MSSSVGPSDYKMELADRLEPLHEGFGLAGSMAGRVVLAGRLNGLRHAQVPEAITCDSPLLLRGSCAGTAALPHRERVLSTAFYLAKAGGTRARSAAWLMRTRGRLDTSGLRILFYHRVSDDRDELAVDPKSFAEQMDYLATEAYRVVDVLSAIDLLDSGEPLARTVALSFDDGFLDVAENALPILSERGFRATVFVATAVTDGKSVLHVVPEAAAAPDLGRHRRARSRRHASLRGPFTDPSQLERARRANGEGGDRWLEAGARKSTRARRAGFLLSIRALRRA